MRVAVAASGPDLDAPMDPRFGRCAYFVIVNTDDMSFEAVENPGPQMGSGAGIAAAQLVADAGAEAVVAGNFGPKATQALQAGGIRTFQAAGMAVGEAAQAAAAGQLPEVTGPTVADKAGMNMGPGSGPQTGPRGGGAGMGRGRGMSGGGQWGDPQQPPMGPWQQGWGPMGPMPGAMGPMGPMMGPMGPMMGPAFPQAQEEMRQYHLAMLRAQADMLQQQLDFVRSQIEYLEDLGE